MSSDTIPEVRKSIHVQAPIAHAFEVFTAGLGRWWPLDSGVGPAPRKRMELDPRLGGNWIEVAADGTETVVGTILQWDPPRRFVFTWFVNEKGKHDPTKRSEVEVRFTPAGASATDVELVHAKFETLGAVAGEQLRKSVDGGWQPMLVRFAAEAERTTASTGKE